jgi:predicted phosphodiesterase
LLQKYTFKIAIFFLGLIGLLFLGMKWYSGNPALEYHYTSKKDLDLVLQRHISNLEPPVEPNGTLLQSNWTYFKGNKEETLKIDAPSKGKGVKVDLPHRVLEPNTALWYTTQVEITESQVWKIIADDGCQMFLEGKQLFQYHEGGYFLLEPTDGKFIDVSIRVLNNAMQGGLREIRVLSKDSVNFYFKNLDNHLEYLYALDFYKENTGTFQVEKSRFEFNKDSLNLAGLSNLFMGYPVLTQPLVSFSNPSIATIKLKTFQNSLVELEWSSDGLNFDQKIRTKPENGTVEFKITDLGRNSTVFYRISQEKSESGIYSFKSPASLKDNFSFTAWGDSQGGWETFSSLVNQSPFQKGDFFIGLGDLVNEGCDPLPWFHFINSLKPALRKGAVMLVPGNHDYDGYYDELVARNYLSLSPHDNYFIQTWGNAAFLALDLNEVFPLGFDQKQDSLFKKAIQSNEWKSAQWHFLLVHQPVHSQGWPGYAGEPFLKEYLNNFFESAEIDFVLSGHTHDYERITKKYGAQSTHFIITGGGGGGIEPLGKEDDTVKMDQLIKEHHYCNFQVNYNHCDLKVYNRDGALIDEKTFVKPLKGIDK